jgi:hypothetical protein
MLRRFPHRFTALRGPGDDGRISLLVVVMTFAVLAMIGLSVDGGGKVRALQRADRIAAEAARAAGQAIDAPEAIRGGDKRIDPAGAVAAAQQYLAAAAAGGSGAVTGSVTVSEDRTEVTVTVTITYTTVFLGMIGIDTLAATRQATAVLVVT